MPSARVEVTQWVVVLPHIAKENLPSTVEGHTVFPSGNQCVRSPVPVPGLADTSGVAGHGSDTGGEFEVGRLFTGVVDRWACFHGGFWPVDGHLSGQGSGAAEFATGVGSFNGQPDYESGRNDFKKQLHGGERNRLHFDQRCWRPEPLHNYQCPRRTGLTNVVVADGAVPSQVLYPCVTGADSRARWLR